MPALTARQATLPAVWPFDQAVTASTVRPRRATAQASAYDESLAVYPAAVVPGSEASFCGLHCDDENDSASARLWAS